MCCTSADPIHANPHYFTINHPADWCNGSVSDSYTEETLFDSRLVFHGWVFEVFATSTRHIALWVTTAFFFPLLLHPSQFIFDTIESETLTFSLKNQKETPRHTCAVHICTHSMCVVGRIRHYRVRRQATVYSDVVNFSFQRLCFLTRCVYFFSVIITVNGEYYFPTPF